MQSISDSMYQLNMDLAEVGLALHSVLSAEYSVNVPHVHSSLVV